jgi:hypothetical protein
MLNKNDEKTINNIIENKTEKMVIKDAHQLDKKIPRNLIVKFGDNYYILKAGLEWKAMQLYGGGNYSLETEIVEKKDGYVLAKATFTSRDGIKYSNFGEASLKNVINPRMQPYLLHLAVTRAECRTLRMATACGYVSKEEIVGSSFNESLNLPEPTPIEKKIGIKNSLDIAKSRKELK